MSFRQLLRGWRESVNRGRRTSRLFKLPRRLLLVEGIEDRTLLSVQFTPAPLTVPGNRPDTALGDMTNFRPVEPYLSVSNSDPGNIAVSTHNGMRVSPNDGATPFTAVHVFPMSTGGDTGTAYTSDGRLFWVNINGAGLGIQEVNPADGTLIGAVHTVDNGGGADDKPFIAADPSIPGSLYVVWTAFPPAGGTRVLVRHSTDYGNNWSAAVRADNPNGSDGFVWPATVTVAPDHLVYVAFHTVTVFGTNNPDNGGVVVVRYNDDLTAPFRSMALGLSSADITFNVQTAGSTRVIPQMQFWTQGSAEPWILADPVRPGNIYVIASDANNFVNDFGDIRIARSTDSGVNWSNNLIVGASGRTALFPNAAIDRFGDIVVAWYDNRRGLVNGANRFKLDVFAKYSTDGGLTFSPEFPVNDQTANVNTPNGNIFDPDVGAVNRFVGPPPTTRIGEYFGIGIWGGTAYVAWNGNSFAGFNNPNGEQVWTKAFAIRGSLAITGTSGDDTITVRNMADNPEFVETLVNGQRQYAGLWSALTDITIFPSSGFDTTNIENTAAGTPVTIYMGPGGGVVSISPTARNLNTIQAPVFVNGGFSGTDTLALFDQSGPAGLTYILGSNSVVRNGVLVVGYNNLINLVSVSGSNGADTYNVVSTERDFLTVINTGNVANSVNVRGTEATGQLTINPGTGGDQIFLTNGGLIDNIGAVVVADGTGTGVTVNDSAFSGDDSYTLSSPAATVMQMTVLRPINFSLMVRGVANLSLLTGSGNDTVNVEGTAAVTNTTIATGNGVNTVNLSPTAQDLNTIAGPLTVNFGVNVNDTLNLNDNLDPAAPLAGAYMVSDTTTTALTAPGLNLTYSFMGGLGMPGGFVDIFANPLSLPVTNNTVNVTCLFNGSPC